jgi:hypothetical protein
MGYVKRARNSAQAILLSLTLGMEQAQLRAGCSTARNACYTA